MSTAELLIQKEQIRTQVNEIIQQEGDAWWYITREEDLLQDLLMWVVEDNDQAQILTIAQEYVKVLIAKKDIQEELQVKYAPQTEQMRRINLQLKQKMN